MAEENLKDFTVNWAIFGLLFVCLIGFAITFMYNNNPIGLNDGADQIFNSSFDGIEGNLYEVEGNADEVLNITAGTDPEASFLGSRDSVGVSYKGYGTGRSFWTSAKTMIAWVFTGTIGNMLLAVFGGLIAWMGGYYIIKWIRTGQ